MRRLWLVSILVLCAAAVGTAVVAPGRLHRIEMAAEWDGHHQDDHKYLGFVPYSEVKDAPDLKVTDDAYRLLKEAGVRNVPEASKTNRNQPPTRTIRDGRTEYDIAFDLAKSPPKDAADFYEKQLAKPVRWRSRFMETVEGLCPDGKTHLVFSTIVTPSSSGGRLRFWRGKRP